MSTWHTHADAFDTDGAKWAMKLAAELPGLDASALKARLDQLWADKKAREFNSLVADVIGRRFIA